ncbi:hypothetical protein EGW08_022290 [Elysia chlorotica]|uniref:Topo IIA-type catalytic domain-containing protein n=1 Tax=Elysia chlorotica TaxID=188477 RepID=A0A433SLC7_ELYCH|nr:hypothetical protein EGW08_022290 [Elysia chlorotica]
MSVIVGRALPDVRDGLKPVHRRVLFAMSELSNYYNRPYKKSARVVGDVIGKYHPHGDTAVYDTIVRMAQPFSLRYTLVDGQGNFGSVDGDSPAAMRYTEIRMQKLTHELLMDLDKETVDFSPNYDNTELVPDVMPTRVPNLLVNGSSGIAVGMATNIPPHNMSEIISGVMAIIDNADITIEELVEKHIPAPDFPTGAYINGTDGLLEAYKTGRGRVIMRAKATIEENESSGKAIRFAETDVRAMGRSAQGVTGMRLHDGQKIVSMLVTEPDSGVVLAATENGYGKRTAVSEYRRTKRASQGVIAISTSDRNGAVVVAVLVDEDEDIVMITNNGTLVRTSSSQVRECGRSAQGVRLINLRNNEKLIGLKVVKQDEEELDDDLEIGSENLDSESADAEKSE